MPRSSIRRALPALLAGLLLSLGGCGARPGPAAVVGDTEECYGGSCGTPAIIRPDSVELDKEDLQMVFPPDVRREDALKVVMRCQRRNAPDNPRLAGVECPIEIGKVKIDVHEGPAGTSFMLRVGDAEQAEALRRWYAEHMPE